MKASNLSSLVRRLREVQVSLSGIGTDITIASTTIADTDADQSERLYSLACKVAETEARAALCGDIVNDWIRLGTK